MLRKVQVLIDGIWNIWTWNFPVILQGIQLDSTRESQTEYYSIWALNSTILTSPAMPKSLLAASKCKDKEITSNRPKVFSTEELLNKKDIKPQAIKIMELLQNGR